MDKAPNKAEVAGCQRKIRYPSKVDALLSERCKELKQASAYQCKVCRHWHLTTNVKGSR